MQCFSVLQVVAALNRISMVAFAQQGQGWVFVQLQEYGVILL